MSKAKNNDAHYPPRATPPNTTSVHIHKARPERLRTTGLHAIADTSKVFGGITPVALQCVNERLAVASSTAPWCNSTTPRTYYGPELSIAPARTDIGRANHLPSRSGELLFYRDGRVTTLDGQTVSVSP